MTERCQTKFTEKFENQNYIIYVGIIVASFAVLYFYRFHFATIAFSYALGCLACYYGLNSNILDSLVNKIKCHSVISGAEKEAEKAADEDCATCGANGCSRHDPAASSEPWVGLQIHKQLDQAIEDFYNAILDQFIASWYSKITLQPFFIDELRYQLRYASACLLQRAVKINYSRFITERLIPCALRHYTLCADLPDGAPRLASKLAVHPAAANRNAELKYLRSVTNAIMPYLLKNGELQSPVFRVLVREIFAGWVLLSLTDALADPYILNALVLLATGDEPMAQLPTTPDYTVEFLSTFARHTDSVYAERARLLRVDVERVVSEPERLYAFMRHVRGGAGVATLQFYKDIKIFQTKILNPELTPWEQAELCKEAGKIFARHGGLRAAVQGMLARGADVRRLQTSPVLYQAARETHVELEKIMLPRFLHSEEFYELLIGSRIPTGYHKQNKKPQQVRLTSSTLKLDSRLKNALRSQALDGHLDGFNPDDAEDGVDNIDILKYLDTIAAEDVREQDLSTCKVVLTNVDTRLQAPPRRGPVRVFSLAVHRVDRGAGARLWAVERSEHDFHLLRSKLLEFHGEPLLSDLPLPSRRDNSPNETLRYKYEDFLQRVLQQSLLQTSELLHLFLTVDGDFSLVVQASTLTANSSDLGNIYQSVTHKLRKEKGQHLESFLKNYLVSSDMERYQALKQGTHVEEALEVIEDEETERVQPRQSRRDIHASVFRNNLGVEPAVGPRDLCHQNRLVGFTQCFMYLLIKVLRVRSCVSGAVGSVLAAARAQVDGAAEGWLRAALARLVTQPRLARLVRLGHGTGAGGEAGGGGGGGVLAAARAQVDGAAEGWLRAALARLVTQPRLARLVRLGHGTGAGGEAGGGGGGGVLAAARAQVDGAAEGWLRAALARLVTQPRLARLVRLGHGTGAGGEAGGGGGGGVLAAARAQVDGAAEGWLRAALARLVTQPRLARLVRLGHGTGAGGEAGGGGGGGVLAAARAQVDGAAEGWLRAALARLVTQPRLARLVRLGHGTGAGGEAGGGGGGGVLAAARAQVDGAAEGWLRAALARLVTQPRLARLVRLGHGTGAGGEAGGGGGGGVLAAARAQVDGAAEGWLRAALARLVTQPRLARLVRLGHGTGAGGEAGGGGGGGVLAAARAQVDGAAEGWLRAALARLVTQPRLARLVRLGHGTGAGGEAGGGGGGGVLAAARAQVDGAAEGWLRAALARLVTQPRLARLVRLGHDVLLNKKPLPPRAEACQQIAAARARLLAGLPAGAAAALGAGAPAAVDAALRLIQRPPLNKQLVYNLLDLCIMELFPELSATEILSPKEPKS